MIIHSKKSYTTEEQMIKDITNHPRYDQRVENLMIDQERQNQNFDLFPNTPISTKHLIELPGVYYSYLLAEQMTMDTSSIEECAQAMNVFLCFVEMQI